MINLHEIQKAILEELERNGERSSTELAKALKMDNVVKLNYHLNYLASMGLVTRRTISPHYIMWSLNNDVYKKWIQNKEEQTEG